MRSHWFIAGKILLNVSAGCGRTGTIIAIYSLYESVEFMMERGSSEADLQDSSEYPDPFYLEGQEKSMNRISVFGTVRRIREMRWNMVKNVEQYKYIYTFMKQWFQERH